MLIGAWLNSGHAEPPIKMTKVWLNDVEAYTGVAAVDAYLVARPNSPAGMESATAAAHVIEDLLRGKPVVLRAVAYGTDCYPRKKILTRVTLADLNTAVLSNPRNGYQRYVAATNSTVRTIRTYMGKLLPRCGNVTFSGRRRAFAAGERSSVPHDRGRNADLPGRHGGVHHRGRHTTRSQGQLGTLMVQGDLKKMSAGIPPGPQVSPPTAPVCTSDWAFLSRSSTRRSPRARASATPTSPPKSGTTASPRGSGPYWGR